MTAISLPPAALDLLAAAAGPMKAALLADLEEKESRVLLYRERSRGWGYAVMDRDRAARELLKIAEYSALSAENAADDLARAADYSAESRELRGQLYSFRKFCETCVGYGLDEALAFYAGAERPPMYGPLEAPVAAAPTPSRSMYADRTVPFAQQRDDAHRDKWNGRD